MEIIDLTLKDFNFYSPSTGELIWDAGKELYNHNAKSLAGFWEFDSPDYHDYYECWYDSINNDFFHVFHIITISNKQMSKAFEKHLVDFSQKAQDIEGEVIFYLEDFILNYDADPNLICFRFSNPENPFDKKYFVLQMNGNPEL